MKKSNELKFREDLEVTSVRKTKLTVLSKNMSQSKCLLDCSTKMIVTIFKRISAFDIFPEYHNDVRFVKMFYCPNSISSLDIIISFPFTDKEIKEFQNEEINIHNKLDFPKFKDETTHNKEFDQIKDEFAKMSNNIFCVGAEFSSFPTSKSINKEKIIKFWKYLKSISKSDLINLSWEELEMYLNKDKLFNDSRIFLKKNFKNCNNFDIRNEFMIESLYFNLENFLNLKSKNSLKKILFVSKSQNLRTDIPLIKSLLEYIIRYSLEMRKDQNVSRLKEYIYGANKNKKSLNLEQFIASRLSKAIKNCYNFHKSLLNSEPDNLINLEIDEIDFFNMRKFLPLIYGSKNSNYRFFSNNLIPRKYI